MVQVNLKQLAVFRAVMVSGSTIEASNLLNLSQPAVSRSLQNLEAQIEHQLFLRQNGRLLPTNEAEQLFLEIDRFQSSVDHLEDTMRRLKRSGGGHLRVIASTPMSLAFLPAVMAAFQHLWPEVRVSVRIVVRRERARWLASQQFDVALLSLPVEYPEKRLHHLAEVSGICILPKDHSLASERAIRAKDLEAENFISIIPDTILRGRVDAAFEKENVIRSRMTIESQTGASVCQLVAQGLGVSVVDPFTAKAFVSSKVVFRRFLPEVPFNFGLLEPLNLRGARFADDFVAIAREMATTFADDLIYDPSACERI